MLNFKFIASFTNSVLLITCASLSASGIQEESQDGRQDTPMHSLTVKEEIQQEGVSPLSNVDKVDYSLSNPGLVAFSKLTNIITLDITENESASTAPIDLEKLLGLEDVPTLDKDTSK